MKAQSLLFLFTIPGLVLLITIVGLFRLIQSKITGKPIRGSSTTGIDVIETVFRPTGQFRIQEERRKEIEGEDSQSGESEFK